MATPFPSSLNLLSVLGFLLEIVDTCRMLLSHTLQFNVYTHISSCSSLVSAISHQTFFSPPYIVRIFTDLEFAALCSFFFSFTSYIFDLTYFSVTTFVIINATQSFKFLIMLESAHSVPHSILPCRNVVIVYVRSVPQITIYRTHGNCCRSDVGLEPFLPF